MDVPTARREAEREVGAPDVAEWLVHAYGARWRDVLARAGGVADGRARLAPGLPYLRGELAYQVEHERAATLGDLLIRRLHVAFETRDAGAAAARDAAVIVAPLLGWDDARTTAELRQYDREASRIFGIDP